MDAVDREDMDIIREVLEGNADRFEKLIDRHADGVFLIVGRRVPHAEVEEVAHEVFVRAWKSLGSFRGDSSFGWWLSRIAVRACHDFWRVRYRSRETSACSLTEEEGQWLESAMGSDQRTSGGRTEDALIARDLMMKGLAPLSPSDRAVLELIHLEERSVREAADLLGWTTANVKVRAHRARKKLRKILEKMEEET
jgi:RNA polymerase sigma-70 factor (ECF subfamily)